MTTTKKKKKTATVTTKIPTSKYVVLVGGEVQFHASDYDNLIPELTKAQAVDVISNLVQGDAYDRTIDVEEIDVFEVKPVKLSVTMASTVVTLG